MTKCAGFIRDLRILYYFSRDSADIYTIEIESYSMKGELRWQAYQAQPAALAIPA